MAQPACGVPYLEFVNQFVNQAGLQGDLEMEIKKAMLMLALILMPVVAQSTNGYFSHGTGLKNRALGGAGVAFPQDALAAATNPAGMAFVGNRIDAGAVLFKPERGYSPDTSLAHGNGGAFTLGPGSENSENRGFIIPSFGLNYMLSKQDAVGLSIYGNGGMNTSYDSGSASYDPFGMRGAGVSFPGALGAGTAGVDLLQVFFNISYAHKFSDKVSAGISPLLTMQSFRSNGLDAFAPFTKTFVASQGAQMPSHLTQNGTDSAFGWGLQVGALAKDIAGMADLGISYRTKIDMEKWDDYADLFAEDGTFDIPSTLWVGLAIEVAENMMLVADYQRIWYGDSDAISNDLQNLFDCPALGGSDLESCLGGNRGAGFGWDNMDIFKIGLQWQARPHVTGRLGYSHASQPIGSDQVLFNILAPAVVEDHITLGATVTTRIGDITLEAMHAFGHSVKGQNPFDPSQTIRLSMEQFEVGAAWSARF